MTLNRSLAPLIALFALAVLYALPAIAPRAVVQDLFGILTLLVLAMNWNMLAGFAGLVSVGQQAFVGIGAYAMFAAIILAGLDPLLGVLIGGLFGDQMAIAVQKLGFGMGQGAGGIDRRRRSAVNQNQPRPNSSTVAANSAIRTSGSQ